MNPDPFLLLLEQTGLAQWLRFSRWGYAAANTAHVAGIAVLFGSVLALDLRLLGLGRTVPLRPLVHFLAPLAALGLLLAVATGVLLFLVQARSYASLDLFWIKIGLILAGTALALAVVLRMPLHEMPAGRAKLVGGASLLLWGLALLSGRLLAFVGD